MTLIVLLGLNFNPTKHPCHTYPKISANPSDCPAIFKTIAIRGDGKSPDQTAIFKFSVFQSISHVYIEREQSKKLQR